MTNTTTSAAIRLNLQDSVNGVAWELRCQIRADLAAAHEHGNDSDILLLEDCLAGDAVALARYARECEEV